MKYIIIVNGEILKEYDSDNIKIYNSKKEAISIARNIKESKVIVEKYSKAGFNLLFLFAYNLSTHKSNPLKTPF